MYQDILNLNKTTKSILKNPDPKASLAYTNSILRKDPAKVNIEGIGLNPNVPLEDEYIQNLQKQIHFMDLEIKLMKEKQAQEEALGGNYQFAKIGIADGKPSIDHILTTTNKLKNMKIDLTEQTNKVEQELLKKREENTIATAIGTNLEKHVKEYDEKLGKILAENGEALTMMRMKLMTEKRQREEVEMEIFKVKKTLEKIIDDNERLRKETELKDIHKNLAQKEFEEEEKYDQEILDTKKKHIDQLQVQKVHLFMATEKDPELQALREENDRLQKKIKECERTLDNTNYKVLEMETLQTLSVKKKEEDQEQKKKLQQELEKWKDQFDETLKSNELKIERKLREADSIVIKGLQADLLKEKHELVDLKIKLENIYKKEKEYVIDEANRTRYKTNLENKKAANETILKPLQHEADILQKDVGELTEKVDKLKFDITQAREDRTKWQAKLTLAEEENITLKTKLEFLEKNINLENDMKKFNVEELSNVIRANQTVNKTIDNFMQKWRGLEDEISVKKP